MTIRLTETEGRGRSSEEWRESSHGRATVKQERAKELKRETEASDFSGKFFDKKRCVGVLRV